MIEIRMERPEDISAVRIVNELAFGQPTEADIIDGLRMNCPDSLSLVAVDGDAVVGHILFTPVVIDGPGGTISGMGLAPMAVLPERQRQGAGSMLVREGIELLGQRGCPFIIVLGHPEYYPHFGFEPACFHGITCQWEGVPDEAFMVMILDRGMMEGVSGVACYLDEFDEAV
ncbi:MAG: N-acetyltransferase [Thermoleophilia bacterium]|nr:N-acetyltransferase [Thermoleophilia bacterium]